MRIVLVLYCIGSLSCAPVEVCQDLEAGSAHLRTAGAPCEKQRTDNSFDDAEKCDGVVEEKCTELDQQILQNVADCFMTVATCDPATDSQGGGFLDSKFDDEVIGCAFKGFNLSTACAEGFKALK